MKAFNPPDTASYTFADYFRLNYEVDEVLAYFGYAFARENYAFRRSPLALERLADLCFRLNENTQHTSFSSEMARREFLIAPVLTELIVYTHSRLRVEYALNVTDKLKGSLDYLLQGKQHLLVIEAKNADLELGFKQLAMELVALDQWIDEPVAELHGAVSIGTVWQFGVLRRKEKQVIQDVNLFRVPADVEDLLRVMIAVLQGEAS
jgi:hypothetical protein